MVHFGPRGGRSHQVKAVMAVKRAIHSLILWRAAQKWVSKIWDGGGAACALEKAGKISRAVLRRGLRWRAAISFQFPSIMKMKLPKRHFRTASLGSSGGSAVAQ